MKPLVRTLILLVRFLSEIGALLAFAVWGFSESGWFGVLPPIAAAAVWGRYMAPKSHQRLDDPVRLIAELVFFGLATSAFAAADAPTVALVYGPTAMICAVVVRYAGEPELREPGARPAA
jgi:uncharacterized protein DUF2568